MNEKPPNRPPIRSRRKSNERAKNKTTHAHHRNELDTGLPALAARRSRVRAAPHRGRNSSQSREKSIGLAQSLTIWSVPSSGTVWRGRVSGWSSP